MERPRLIRKFTETVGLLDRGAFERACDEALTDALTTLAALPKEIGKASITVELEISYQQGRVDILPKIKSKLPEAQAYGRTPFWTHDGALSTQHPSQHDMFPRIEVDRDVAQA